MADPRFLMAHCLTEPRGASDRWLPYNAPEANMDTTAVRRDGHWIINGRKQFISNGYDASLYVVYANTDRVGRACCRGRAASWSRAIRPGSRSPGATRPSAAAS